MIGAQAIKLSKYGLRIVDILEVGNESDLQVYRRCGISKIFETLRTVSFLMNSVNITNTYPKEVNDSCTCYFNLFALIFKELCNSTVWALGRVPTGK